MFQDIRIRDSESDYQKQNCPSTSVVRPAFNGFLYSRLAWGSGLCADTVPSLALGAYVAVFCCIDCSGRFTVLALLSCVKPVWLTRSLAITARIDCRQLKLLRCWLPYETGSLSLMTKVC